MRTLMTQLLFYLSYAVRNLRRGGRWTNFAILSIAAGVATVVALRSLSLAIEDSLIENVRLVNHGDIKLEERASSGPLAFSFSGDDDHEFFSEHDMQRVEQWVADNDADMSAYIMASNIQVTAVDAQTVGRPQFINSFFIDPQTFPPTGDIEALEPRGTPLRELFTGGDEVVISDNLAASQGIEVGDRVRVSNTEDEFIVRGIIPTETEASLRDPFSAFFGFAYFDLALTEKLQVDPGPNRIALTVPPGSDLEAMERQLSRLFTRRPRIQTVDELLQDNQEIADFVGSFIVVLGLGALLIGGVGIMNTMLVMIRRRTMEIATLKTFGLKGRQVAGLFVAEAFLLGIVGSLVGVIAGLALSGAVNSFGEAFVQQPLVWRFHPEVVIFGFALGVTTTVIFGVLPVLTTTRIRPAIILRPNESHFPGVGILQSLLALIIVTVVLGLIAGRILTPAYNVAARDELPALSPNMIGIVGVGVTLLIIGILIGLLWIVVWFISHLPAFGSVDLHIALRNLTTRRIRTATTLLALSVGMFALSSIVFWGEGLRDILRLSLQETFGGNVIVVPILPPSLSDNLIDERLEALEGVRYTTRIINYDDIRMTHIDSRSVGSRFFDDVVVRDTNNPTLNNGTVLAGRDLTLEDRGQPVMVAEATEELLNAGLKLGSTVTFWNDDRAYDVEVVGLLAPDEDFGPPRFSSLLVAPDVLDGDIDFELTILQVDEDHLNEVLLSLSSIPLVFAFDITFIDGLLKRLIDQFSAIPTLVGLLSLFAAATIMANTVSLATLERRRQIGVLKAIGLKGKRVLIIMLLENTLIGLVGAVLGIGISVLGTSVMTTLGLGETIPIPQGAILTGALLVLAAIGIAWLATFLSARVAIRERVLNVLRYE
ncbi:MAG: FtsX-like permease family protein [Chloroflexi bacterium]|nr:MAG: FtsX-like permease family protein [Chloroflexota bacterium]